MSCSSGQPAFGRAIELADNVAHVGVGAERWLGAGAEPIVEAQAAPVQRLQWP